MYIEQILELLERLDGSGIVVENLDLAEAELRIIGFCGEDDDDCDDESDDEGMDE